MSERMFYIENTSHDPRYNLALEEYVFKNLVKSSYEGGTGIPVLLLWRNEPSVIVGKFQNTVEEINYKYVNEKGIHVVRRNTGGGAVYHDLGNLNYSFIIPDVDSKVDFKTFTRPLIKALVALGVPAEQTGRNDILVNGKKFSGNAQEFYKNRLLHHGTIMFDVDTNAVESALKVRRGKFRSKATKSVRGRVTNLKPFFDLTDAEELKSTLLDWFHKEYELSELELTEEQKAEIRILKETKYDTYDWNYGRSPKADVVRSGFFRCGYVEFHFQIEHHKIIKLELVGDFFASRDIAEFEENFIGCDYTKDALLRILQVSELSSYLGDVTANELIEMII